MSSGGFMDRRWQNIRTPAVERHSGQGVERCPHSPANEPFMSHATPLQEQLGTRLQCPHCKTAGYATWDAAEDMGPDGSGTMIRVTSGFFVRGTDKQGNLEIACLKCGC